MLRRSQPCDDKGVAEQAWSVRRQKWMPGSRMAESCFLEGQTLWVSAEGPPGRQVLGSGVWGWRVCPTTPTAGLRFFYRAAGSLLLPLMERWSFRRSPWQASRGSWTASLLAPASVFVLPWPRNFLRRSFYLCITSCSSHKDAVVGIQRVSELFTQAEVSLFPLWNIRRLWRISKVPVGLM